MSQIRNYEPVRVAFLFRDLSILNRSTSSWKVQTASPSDLRFVNALPPSVMAAKNIQIRRLPKRKYSRKYSRNMELIATFVSASSFKKVVIENIDLRQGSILICRYKTVGCHCKHVSYREKIS